MDTVNRLLGRHQKSITPDVAKDLATALGEVLNEAIAKLTTQLEAQGKALEERAWHLHTKSMEANQNTLITSEVSAGRLVAPIVSQVKELADAKAKMELDLQGLVTKRVEVAEGRLSKRLDSAASWMQKEVETSNASTAASLRSFQHEQGKQDTEVKRLRDELEATKGQLIQAYKDLDVSGNLKSLQDEIDNQKRWLQQEIKSQVESLRKEMLKELDPGKWMKGMVDTIKALPTPVVQNDNKVEVTTPPYETISSIGYDEFGRPTTVKKRQTLADGPTGEVE